MTVPLTPTEQRLFDLLADGAPHARDEMTRVVDDGMLVGWSGVCFHVSNLRGKVRAAGLDIIPRMVNRAIKYQLVRVYESEEVAG